MHLTGRKKTILEKYVLFKNWLEMYIVCSFIYKYIVKKQTFDTKQQYGVRLGDVLFSYARLCNHMAQT